MIIRNPQPCPKPGPELGQQWEQKHNGKTVYELAPAVGTYMAEIKRYCEALDEFIKY